MVDAEPQGDLSDLPRAAHRVLGHLLERKSHRRPTAADEHSVAHLVALDLLGQISLRIPTAWLKEAEEISKLIAKPGIEPTRADTLRYAIARGFEVLRAEAKAAKKK